MGTSGVLLQLYFGLLKRRYILRSEAAAAAAAAFVAAAQRVAHQFPATAQGAEAAPA